MSIQILIIEDSPYHSNYFIKILSKFDNEIKVIHNGQEAYEYLINPESVPDIVLVDHNLPGMNGTEIIKALKNKGFDYGFIYVTADSSIKTAVEAMRAGAYDFVLKSVTIEHELPIIIEKVYKILQDKKHKLALEQQLKESEEHYKSLFTYAQVPILLIESHTGQIIDANKAAISFYKWHKNQLLATNILNIDTATNDEKKKKLLTAISNNRTTVVCEHRIADGTIRQLEVNMHLIEVQGKKLIYAILHDITQNIKLRRENVLLHEKNYNIVQNSPIGIGVVIHKSFCFSNKALEKILDCPAEKLAQINVFDFICDEQRDAMLSQHKLALQGKLNAYKSEFQIINHNEISIWLKVHSVAINWEGQPASLYFIEDISLLKKQQKTLQENEENFRNIFNSIVDGVTLTSFEGTFIKVNRTFCKMLGYSENELTQLQPDLIVTEQHRNTREKVLQNFKLTEKQLFESENITKTGAIIPVEINSRIIQFDGKPTILSIVRDITKRKITEKELLRAKEKAEESDRLKSYFLANISHEIRTPMNSILGFSELLQKHDLPQQQRNRYFSVIKQSTSQLLAIITDFIEISKIESKQMELTEEQVNLNILISTIHENFESKNYDKSEVKIKCKKALHNSEAEIITDSERLTHILEKLISNAYKFTPSGTIEFGYAIENIENLPTLKFFVSDTGIGIKEENQKIIFDKFRQEDDSHTRRYGGTGLGLTISKGIVELLGGKIWVDSKLGNGSIFYFTIPYKPVVKKNAKCTKPDCKKIDWSDKVILIVEDNPANANLLEAILEGTGAKILFAVSGLEAVQICGVEEKIDLVLMDVQLPDISGYKATSLIKMINENIIVIAQTAHTLESDRIKSFEAGCNDYLAKPIFEDVLLTTIAKHFVTI